MSKSANLVELLKAARRVSTPLVAVSTPDPAETMRVVQEAFEQGGKTPIPVVRWDSHQGLSPLNAAGKDAIKAVLETDDAGTWPGLSANPAAALGIMAALPGEMRDGDEKITQRGTIVFMLNAQRFVEDRPGVQNAQVVQGVWNLRDPYKGTRRTLVMLGPSFSLPPELAQDVILFDEPFPADEALARIAHEQATNAGVKLTEPVVTSSVDALRGMSAFTAEQVVAMSLDERLGVDLDQLWERKIKVIEQTPGLSVDRGPESFDDVRGLANFRRFATALIGSRRGPTVFVRVDEMEKYFGGLGQGGGPSDNTGTTQDRLGVLLRTMEDEAWTGLIALGHAGCGKSLMTKALANTATKVTGRRVLSIALDLGETQGGVVGESERKIRTAMKVIKSLAAGGRVCFVATCNGIEVLPPALKRRFKLGTWMFDLPDAEEKRAMWDLNLQRYGLTEPKRAGSVPDDKDWTGADIRNVCDTADALEVTLEEACQFTTFVAQSDPDAISRLRRLADGRLVSASRPGVYRAPFADRPYEAGAPAGSGKRRALGKED